MNLTMAIVFAVLVTPLLVIMMAIAIYTDAKAREVNLETNED